MGRQGAIVSVAQAWSPARCEGATDGGLGGGKMGTEDKAFLLPPP